MGDSTRLVEQQGIGFVKYLCAKYAMLYRDILQHDKGIDGEIELVDKSQIQNKHIGVQIKSRSQFDITRQDEISITVTEQNLSYWRAYGRPVVLMAYSKEEERVWWTRVDNAISKTIHISLGHTFSINSADNFIEIIRNYYTNLIQNMEVKNIAEILQELGVSVEDVLSPITKKLNQAEEFIQEKKYLQAANLYRALCTIYEQKSGLWFNYCGLLLEAGQYEEALQVSHEMRNQFPLKWESYYFCGVSLEVNGSPFEAKSQLEEAIHINPSAANALAFLGLINYRLGLYIEAKYYIFFAIVHERKDPQLYFNFGLCCEALELHQDALQSYNEALKLDLNCWDANYNKALLLKSMFYFWDALECLDRATDVDPTDYRAYYQSGFILKDLGHFERAIQKYRIALSLGLDSVSAYLDLGTLFYRNGHIEESKEYYSIYFQRIDLIGKIAIMDLGFNVASIIEINFDGIAASIIKFDIVDEISVFSAELLRSLVENKMIDSPFILDSRRELLDGMHRDYRNGETNDKNY